MFEKVLVKTPKRSRLDFSHGNTLSMQFGKLTPTEIRFIVPGDDVSVSMEQMIRVAPLPVPTFLNMKVRHDWFFVPLSMMYNQEALDTLLGKNPTGVNRFHATSLTTYLANFTGMPLRYGEPGEVEPFVPGSLHDYFNLPVFSDVNMTDISGNLNAAFGDFRQSPDNANYIALRNDAGVKAITDSLPGPCLEPHLAYHYIWRDWYRFTGMDDAFIGAGPDSYYLENHILNEWFINNPFAGTGTVASATTGVSSAQAHGTGTYWRNYLGIPYFAYLKKDMFTSGRYGSKPQVLIPTGASGTIPNFRTASALQKFIDILYIGGQRYWDKVKAVWNEVPAGMKCERAQFIARYMSYIKVGEVITTTTNQYAETGDYAGRGMLVDGRYLFKRHFTEHGWLMCISSIVPEMAYNGYDRQLTDHNLLDTPIPTFASVGDQSIINREIRVMYDGNINNNDSFGDQFRYYAYKADVNRIHGDFLNSTFQAWTALLPSDAYRTMNARDFSLVDPSVWNKIFDVTGNTTTRNPFFQGRFYVDLTFHEFITRNLPKYVSYAL